MFWEKREQKIFFLYEKKNKKSEKGEKINEFNNGVVVVGCGAGGGFWFFPLFFLSNFK